MPLRFSPTRGSASLVLNSMVRGPQGTAATLALGAVTALLPGATPTVVNAGDSAAAVFDFGIPTSKTVAVGTTTTGAEGTNAAVADSGDASGSVFDFTIPRGASPAIGYTFSTTTTDGDPGNGIARFNNATPASVTEIYFDNLDADGNTVTSWLDTFDDSTSTNKGVLTFSDVVSPATKMVFSVSGSVVDGTGYRKVTVVHISGATLFTNARRLAVVFSRTGDAGAGDFSTNTSSSVDGEMLLFSGTGGKTGKRSTLNGGLLKSTSGVPSIASAGTDYYAPGSTDVAVADGGTGASTAPDALTNLGATPLAGGKTLTGGFKATPYAAGTKSTGTYTPLYSDGNFQTATNGGAHTLDPPADDCSIIVQYTNNASAGAITTSNFTKKTGDSITTVNGDDFFFFIVKIGSFSHLHVQALQ